METGRHKRFSFQLGIKHQAAAMAHLLMPGWFFDIRIQIKKKSSYLTFFPLVPEGRKASGEQRGEKPG
jgi:hypothetical protein